MSRFELGALGLELGQLGLGELAQLGIGERFLVLARSSSRCSR